MATALCFMPCIISDAPGRLMTPTVSQIIGLEPACCSKANMCSWASWWVPWALLCYWFCIMQLLPNHMSWDQSGTCVIAAGPHGGSWWALLCYGFCIMQLLPNRCWKQCLSIVELRKHLRERAKLHCFQQTGVQAGVVKRKGGTGSHAPCVSNLCL